MGRFAVRGVCLLGACLLGCSEPDYSTTGYDVTRYVPLESFDLYRYEAGQQRQVLEITPAAQGHRLAFLEEVGGPPLHAVTVESGDAGLLALSFEDLQGQVLSPEPAVTLGTRSMYVGQPIPSNVVMGEVERSFSAELLEVVTQVSTPYNEGGEPFQDVLHLRWDDAGAQTGLQGEFWFAQGIGLVAYQREGEAIYLLAETGTGG